MDTAIDWFDAFLSAESANDGRGRIDGEADRLIRASAAGDDEAFGRLVALYQERVYHFCYRWLGDPEDAREACQDTFIRVYGAIGRYEHRGNFMAWLYRIALNQCRDRHKSKSHRQRRDTRSVEDGEAVEVACSLPKPDETSVRQEELERLRRKIASLPVKLRTAVILCGIEGLSQKDAAAVLHCSVRAVESRLRRAREVLSDWWEKEGTD